MQRTNSSAERLFDARVAAYLRALMSARRVTLDDVAAGTGISRATLDRRRNGKSGFTLDELGRLAEYFGVALGQFAEPPDLLGGEPGGSERNQHFDRRSALVAA